MARRKRGIFSLFRRPSLPDLGLETDTKKSIFIVFIMALGAVSLLGLFDAAGILGKFLRDALVLGFGWMKFVFPIILLVWGFFLYREEEQEIRGGNYLGAFLFILSICALMFLFIEPAMWRTALGEGRGGGYVGLVLADSLYRFTGLAASWLITVGLLITSILLLFGAGLKHLFGQDGFLGKIFSPLLFIASKLISRGREKEGDEEDEKEEDEEEADDEDEESKETDEDDEEEGEDKDEEEEEREEPEGADDFESGEDEKGKSEPVFRQTEIRDEDQDLWWKKKTGVKISLPLDLLSGLIGRPKTGDIGANKEIIKRTMENFGIAVEMGEVNIGPTVTQYTFKPAEGIKLSKIAILGNDLALALAMHPIRIEAPIPNRSLVGVEVPNKAKATVGLREIMESRAFKESQSKSNLTIALGRDVTTAARVDDLGRMPHLLVAGATNTGKSVCLNSIIVSLLYQNNPDDLRLILVDPKRVELSLYSDIPYLLTPVITGFKETINALKWCLNEMDRRFDILKMSRVKNIESYNEKFKMRMPHIVFIIDELADLMVAAGREVEAGVIRLSQMARAVGIHLVLATQRPSVDIITGVIKANMPARMAFAVASGVDSKTILDHYGAEKLLGRGDMLFKNQEMHKPTRIQGAFVSEMEIKKVVRKIKEQSVGSEYLYDITQKQKVKGMGGAGLDTSGDESDEFYEEARELVINSGKASTTFLQRKFGIGYARAAKILDALEEAGVVGPANGAKPREILISREQYELIAEMGVSGASLHKRGETAAPEDYLNETDDQSDTDDREELNEEEDDIEISRNQDIGGEETDGDDGDDEEDETDKMNIKKTKKPRNQETGYEKTDEDKKAGDDENGEEEQEDEEDESDKIFGINKDVPARKPNEKRPINNFEDKLFSK